MVFPLRLCLLMMVWLLGGCVTLPGKPAPDMPTAIGDSAMPAASGATQLPSSPDSQATQPPTSQTPPAPLPVETLQEDTPPPLIDLTIPPADIWQRIRRGFAMPDLHDPLVAQHQSWYLNRPELLRRIFERGRRYLYYIIEEIEKRAMPSELALLPMIESAFNPRAVSPARAMGIWQFLPSTGKTYDLDQNWWVDERRDIIASTEAALTYLQKIYEMHGDWHLALASYNWGEGAVARAIAKNQAKGLPTDYAHLTMPTETRNYVPKLQALKNIIAQPEVFGIYLPPIPNRPYFQSVTKPARIDVALAAELAGISVEEFIALNPAYHRPVIDGKQAGEELLLPVEKIGTFIANLERYEAEDKPLTQWLTYTMKRGDTLARVAARFKLSVMRLRQINGISARVKVRPGFTLLVPRPGSSAAEAVSRALPEPLSTPPGKRAKPASKAKASSGKSRPDIKATGRTGAKKAANKPPRTGRSKRSPRR